VKIIIWISSLIIVGFFILSALGWFMATYMTITGKLGPEATEFYSSLNVLDHMVRLLQVLLAVAASITLILFRQISKKLFGICLLISVISFLFISKWSITFLPFPILILVYIYVYWLNRRGYLR